MKVLTLDDFDLRGKTIYLRVDMNSPMDPHTLKISSTRRIEEVARTLGDVSESKVVLASHQGRVGNSEYTGMDQHAAALEQILNRRVTYVEDVIGSAARDAIKKMQNGDIILLDNLRLCAEENYEFSPADAANTIMVKRMAGLFDLCVLDSFPSAHRSHPSIVGFPQRVPACAGRMAESEVKNLDEIMTVAKAPYVVVLGGAKVPDRIESIKMLIQNGRADHILLTGVIGNAFLRAQRRIPHPLGIPHEDEIVQTACDLLDEYPDVFFTPVDIAVESGSERLELDVRNLNPRDHIYDIGAKTADIYSRLIASAGTAFMSGPAGYFEMDGYDVGTRWLLEAVAASMATTIVSGGHLTSALKRYGLDTHINHISTAGGALVRYLSGVKLPMIGALEEAANRRATQPDVA